jgi:hypothetical protein
LAGALTALPNDPGLADTPGSVIGNLTNSAPGFGAGSWQATGVKSNYYVTPQALFGHSIVVGDIASISYWTDQFNYAGNSNWSLYLYTLPSGAGDETGWYRSRLVASPGAGAAGWDQWTPSNLTFSDPTRNGNAYSAGVTLAGLTSGTVTWANTSTQWNYTGETVLYIGLQTDSAVTDFTGLLDGLQVTLNGPAGESGSVNFEAAPEPATWSLTAGCLLVGIGLLRRNKLTGLREPLGSSVRAFRG